MKTPPIGSIVAVEWLDAWIDIGESKPAHWKDKAPIVTYGILMRCGEVVTVASETMPDGEYRSVTHIPRGIVQKIARLK